MKMDFLRKLKLFLYALSFAQIFIAKWLADKTSSNVKFMVIALVLLALNVIIYKIAAKRVKKDDNGNT